MISGKMLSLVAALVLGATAVQAELHEVQMVNRAESGRMAFEPAFLRVQPGDTVRFIASDRGHNAETIATMLPAGVEGFAGKINEEIEIVLDVEGLYGVKCKPHFNMGMVMTIAVGDVSQVPDTYFEGRIPKKAMARFDTQLTNLN